MSEDNKKINLEASVVAKKSQGFKEVAHKATAGLSEAQAIEEFTIGSYKDDEREEDES